MNMHQPTAAEQLQKVKELKKRFFQPQSVNLALEQRKLERQESHALQDLRLELENAKAAINRRDATIRRFKQQVIDLEQEIECHRETISVLTEICGHGPKDIGKQHPRQIIERVLADKHPSVTYFEIIGRRRMKHIVAAKHDCAAALFIERPDMTIEEIAKTVGYADHTSVIYALKGRGLVRGN